MARRPRRNHSPAFKAKVALAATKGDRTLAEPAQQIDAHANQITQWRSIAINPLTMSLSPRHKPLKPFLL